MKGRGILIVIGVFFPLAALAEGAEEAAARPCDFLEASSARRSNCERLFSEKLIPNEKALTYTLAYLRDNSGALADPSCLPKNVGFSSRTVTVKKRGKTIRKSVTDGKYGEENVTHESLKKGIQNPCVFLLNDISSSRKKTPAYLVDLCSEDPGKLVTAFETNKGTGTGPENKSFRDIEGRETSLVGAFVTAPQTFAFVPFKDTSGYRAIRKKYGRVAGLRLFGLNSSNNETHQGKPMHASPFDTSWGCPSVKGEDAWVMEKLVEKGPALVMSYGPEVYHQSSTACDNDPPLSDKEKESLAKKKPSAKKKSAKKAQKPKVKKRQTQRRGQR